MIDHAHLEALLALEKEGSFDGAANALGISPSAISQRIKLLEERVGVILVNRQSPLQITDKGVALCRHAEMIALWEENLFNNVFEEFNLENNKSLKIIVNDDSLSSWFMGVIEKYKQENDDLFFNITISDQDHSINEMKNGLALAAISEQKKPVQGYNSNYLGLHAYKATASPKFIEKYFPNGVTLEALKNAPSLRYSSLDDLQNQWIKQEFKESILLQNHILPSSHGFVDASIRGIAWGMNPALMVDKYIRSGELQELIPNTILYKPLYWHYSRLVAKPLNKLTQTVIEKALLQLNQSKR